MRIMQLYFNWKFISTMVANPIIENHYPDLTWSLKSSFATDAYTTICSLLSTGNYSFGRLGQECREIQKQIQTTEQNIDIEIPNFKNIRNQIFCHAVKRKSPDVINKIYLKFGSIFRILTDLHLLCCQELNVKDDDYEPYNPNTLKSLNDEINDFGNMLLEYSLK